MGSNESTRKQGPGLWVTTLAASTPVVRPAAAAAAVVGVGALGACGEAAAGAVGAAGAAVQEAAAAVAVLATGSTLLQSSCGVLMLWCGRGELTYRESRVVVWWKG